MPAGYFDASVPRVIAHRGLATIAPENTLLAFLTALNAGVTHLETDVHASRDGFAVISHDPDLRRLGDRPGNVRDLTMRQLGRIALGAGQAFCSLAEALDAFPDARFNIDVKAPEAIEPTIEAVRATRATGRVLIASFDTARRRATLRGLAGAATSASGRASLIAVAAANLGLGPVVRRTLGAVDAGQLPERVLGMPTTLPRVVRQLHRAGVEVHIWTVNDREQMERLLDAGVDGLISDRADLALQVVRKRF